MKKIFFLSILSTIITSCAASFGPQGVVYYGREVALTSHNDIKPLKTGKSCLDSYISLVTVGDASVLKAKENGKITKVASVSYKFDNYLVYARYCTIVRGE
jgi:hypothetical protein